jgi:hypothetical protein
VVCGGGGGTETRLNLGQIAHGQNLNRLPQGQKTYVHSFNAFKRRVISHMPFADIIRSSRMRWAGHVARMVEDRGVHRVLVGKPEGKRPLGRPRCRWDDKIKMDF